MAQTNSMNASPSTKEFLFWLFGLIFFACVLAILAQLGFVWELWVNSPEIVTTVTSNPEYT